MKGSTLILNLTIAGTLAGGVSVAAPEAIKPPRILPRGTLQSPAPGQVNDWPDRIARVDPGSHNNAWAKPEFDHREWGTMKLPVHWENAGLPDYDGVVWFRRHIEVPAAMTKGEAVLSLGAIDDMDVTWLNGVRVGGYEQAGQHFTPRNYKLPAGLLKAGRNAIAVRVMDHGHGGGIAATHGKMELTGGGQTLDLTGPWHYRRGANLATLLRSEGTPTPREPQNEPFDGRFAWRDGDVMAFVGGTSMVKQFESGYLEALLTQSTTKRVYFRDVAWQADTVYRQQRPRDFGTHLDLLHRINATVIVAQFGQMEALDGTTKLPDFIAAYQNLLDEFAQRTPRLILIGPRPFAKPASPYLPDLSIHNGDVAAYAGAIRQLAERRGFLFVDLAGFEPEGLTTDGLHLTPQGHLAWARLMTKQLVGTVPEAGNLDPLRTAIQRKNTLWRQHWRPTNWSFLYGNRQQVPSSHDHRPGRGRWFPKEIDAIIPMIEKTEDEILKMRGGRP